MSKKEETRTIDGTAFTVRMLTADVGLDVGYDLAQALGPAIGKLDQGDVGEAAAMLFARLPKEDFKRLVHTLVDSADADGKPVREVFNHVFMGKPMTLMKVFAFALELNFSSFFAGLGGAKGLLAKAMARAASGSMFPNTSAGGGSSGGSSTPDGPG